MAGRLVLSVKDAPDIVLNPEGIITIRGRCMNGSINELKSRIDEWVDSYLLSPAEVTTMEFYLEYFNKVHSGLFLSLIRKIASLKSQGKKYSINWYYEEGDEDMLEKGEFFSEELNIPINFIEIYDVLMPEYHSPKSGTSFN
jgi:hypothetical protein